MLSDAISWKTRSPRFERGFDAAVAYRATAACVLVRTFFLRQFVAWSGRLRRLGNRYQANGKTILATAAVSWTAIKFCCLFTLRTADEKSICRQCNDSTQPITETVVDREEIWTVHTKWSGASIHQTRRWAVRLVRSFVFFGCTHRCVSLSLRQARSLFRAHTNNARIRVHAVAYLRLGGSSCLKERTIKLLTWRTPQSFCVQRDTGDTNR